MLKEFKQFALKGNMVDLAVGVIIGSAFGGLVNSVVNDIFMPIIGLITGGIDFSNMFIQLAGDKKATLLAAKEAGATLSYGNFITLLINFLIISWILFFLVKGMNKMTQKQEEVEKPKEMSPEGKLLTEIRDLLAAQKE
ncbi:large-conductance mechanosensitive channel [Bartonella bacilliformis str. Heidi Mejia]|uniref:Large-conductance mechanosensitive channel n=2 Tax=Bartonella bacilliformis TaxID=774 RepID=MSCL_BARBK|nr:large conductance mechanosensitive channel protein MscL [Bartonella bacilliformis]A1URL2.1 RecName: Full=Large-conductance mechanosensitive channel [Bartonella bacilliformis KC583]ABM45284.1 large conductance mechanosensitive channel protein [Bartonella bacilliformis KC583]AMG85468.1 large conductance mechanosensitive channel protein MscL [Bartonella bacilliformis]EKS45735.1 large-conductance mechanosensitive channel [Bartonella bacilliformis INS]EYS90244.1 large-conductance mechanosensitiv